MEWIQIKLLGKDLKVRARFMGDVQGFPFDKKDQNYHNKYKIVVSCGSGKERVERYFFFYGSAHDHEKGKTEMSDKDTLLALRCLFDDAWFGTESLEDFCSDCGFDIDSRKAEKVWKACRKQLKRINDLGFTVDEICDAINEFSEKGIE